MLFFFLGGMLTRLPAAHGGCFSPLSGIGTIGGSAATSAAATGVGDTGVTAPSRPAAAPQHSPAPLCGETEAQELGTEARAQAWPRQSHAKGVQPPLRGLGGPPAPHGPKTQLSRTPNAEFSPSFSSATEQLLQQDDKTHLSSTQAPHP